MRLLLAHNFYQQFGGEDAAYLMDKRMLSEQGAGSIEVRTYERNNKDIRTFGLLDMARFPGATISSRQTRDDIRKLVNAWKPDAAYIHNVFPLISPSLYFTLRDEGVLIIQMMHDFRFLCPNGWFFTHGHVCEKCKHGNTLPAIAFRCYRDNYALSAVYAASVAAARRNGVLDVIDIIACPSPFMADKLEGVGVPRSRIRIKPHHIDAASRRASPGQGDYVLFMGRLSPEKGLRTLLDAIRLAPEIPLRIAGTGPSETDARRFAADHQLHNVSFEGFQSGEAKWKLLEGARIVVAPSECYETFGMVVLEAFACGKPVVATWIGSFPHLIEDGATGRLVPPGDPAALAEAIKVVFNDVAACRTMGTRGRELAEQTYNADENYRILHGMIETAASRREKNA
ncbi:MAG: glycosyltransferase family 4 protein [bacterium]